MLLQSPAVVLVRMAEHKGIHEWSAVVIGFQFVPQCGSSIANTITAIFRSIPQIDIDQDSGLVAELDKRHVAVVHWEEGNGWFHLNSFAVG